MQINRLFEMVYILLDRKKITAKELAEHFEVSSRTILRDIDTLSAAGIPIYTQKGRYGGISILDNFVLNKSVFSDAEQNQILFALQSLSSAQYKEADDVLNKLSTIFHKSDSSWIEVDFSYWGNVIVDKTTFETLKKAIIKNQTLSITYMNASGKTDTRKIHALKLVFKSRAWYLQAYCLNRSDYRTFKISRIKSLQLLDAYFSEKDYVAPPIDMDDTPDSLVHMTLQFSAEMAYRIHDDFPPSHIILNSDGSFTVTLDLPEDEWLYGFLLSFGPCLKVISPSRVRERIIQLLEMTLHHYEH